MIWYLLKNNFKDNRQLFNFWSIKKSNRIDFLAVFTISKKIRELVFFWFQKNSNFYENKTWEKKKLRKTCEKWEKFWKNTFFFKKKKVEIHFSISSQMRVCNKSSKKKQFFLPIKMLRKKILFSSIFEHCTKESIAFLKRSFLDFGLSNAWVLESWFLIFTITNNCKM